MSIISIVWSSGKAHASIHQVHEQILSLVADRDEIHNWMLMGRETGRDTGCGHTWYWRSSAKALKGRGLEAPAVVSAAAARARDRASQAESVVARRYWRGAADHSGGGETETGDSGRRSVPWAEPHTPQRPEVVQCNCCASPEVGRGFRCARRIPGREVGENGSRYANGDEPTCIQTSIASAR